MPDCRSSQLKGKRGGGAMSRVQFIYKPFLTVQLGRSIFLAQSVWCWTYVPIGNVAITKYENDLVSAIREFGQKIDLISG